MDWTHPYTRNFNVGIIFLQTFMHVYFLHIFMTIDILASLSNPQKPRTSISLQASAARRQHDL